VRANAAAAAQQQLQQRTRRVAALTRRTAQLCLGGGGVVLGIAYVTDVSHWPARVHWLKALLGIEAALFFGFGVLLFADTARFREDGFLHARSALTQPTRDAQQPEAAHVFWALALPLAQTVLKRALLPDAPLLSFLRTLAFGLVAGGTALLAAWVAWVGSDARHAFANAVPELAQRIHCKPVRKRCRSVCFACASSPPYPHCSLQRTPHRAPAAWLPCSCGSGPC
jgi:hypothetical protein